MLIFNPLSEGPEVPLDLQFKYKTVEVHFLTGGSQISRPS